MRLPAGAVITVEPGIYIPAENLGVRIEDDILVTPQGYELLSSGAPRTTADIVFFSTLLIAALQFHHPFAAGFMHRDYEAPSRTLRQIVLSADEGGVWFDWAYHVTHSVEYHERWARLMRERPHWWQRFDWPGAYTADEMPLGFYFHWGHSSNRTAFLIFRVPYWFLVIGGAVLPAVGVYRRL